MPDSPVVDPAHAAPFEAAPEYTAAIERIRAASVAYYEGADVHMDDATYDALLARVAATEAVRPEWRVEGTPTETVAAGAPIGGDVVHSEPMLGLDNVFDEDELRRWAARLDKLVGHPVAVYTVEPK